MNCANWLETTPPGKEDAKRKEATRFILEWTAGSPSVSIEINTYVMDLVGKNDFLLPEFFGGWARYAIQNKESYDKYHANAEAIKSMIKLYKLTDSKKNKKLDELAGMSDGQLLSWVKKQVKG